MLATMDAPHYQEGAKTNHAFYQISQLVRNGSDARRLLAPIRDWADLSDRDEEGEELDSILQKWDNPSFPNRADRVQAILDELDELWTAGNDVDMMELGERRLVLEALSAAISQRLEQFKVK